MTSPVYVPTSAVVYGGLWRLFPAINCNHAADIPSDYPGPIGVPITFFEKLCKEQFELIGMLRPKIRGKAIYQRLIIRHLHPDLPEYIDLAGWLEKVGADYEVEALP